MNCSCWLLLDERRHDGGGAAFWMILYSSHDRRKTYQSRWRKKNARECASPWRIGRLSIPPISGPLHPNHPSLPSYSIVKVLLKKKNEGNSSSTRHSRPFSINRVVIFEFYVVSVLVLRHQRFFFFHHVSLAIASFQPSTTVQQHCLYSEIPRQV